MAQKLRPQAETLSGSPQPNFTGYNPSTILAKRAPTTLDTGYALSQLWLDKVGDDLYGLVDVTAGVATWNLLAATPGEIATLTASSGGALTPTAGNMNILGTANQITTAGSGSTITLTLPSAITAPGSLTTTTTLAAGTTVTAGTAITATAGDITATLGNVIINGAAKQLRVHGGAVTDFIGQATLTSGTVTVLNTNIAATDRIFVNRSAVNGSTALGVFKVVISASTNFVITACKPADGTTETNDASTVDYFIVRQV
jgi:hypothetical protein